MNTIELTLSIPEYLQDMLIAELDLLSFTGFVQESISMKAYVPEQAWNTESANFIRTWLDKHQCDVTWDESVIGEQDWNEPWEKSIVPIQIGAFYIYPSWSEVHQDAERLIKIEIDPKMSFGTGHHETTRLILRAMPSFIEEGDVILDAGTGTGILSIAAIKLGAAKAVAFDVDSWAFDNSSENISRNQVRSQIDFRLGGIDVVPESGFDAILANINRSVLISYAPSFHGRLKPGGVIVLSGVLVTDKARITDTYEKAGFKRIDDAEEGEWWCCVFRRFNEGTS